MRRSFRLLLREFQAMRGDDPDPGFVADLEWLENRDLDLSVRLGALLAFNALAVTVGTHPISASPGAPLSLDAATQPWPTLACCASLVPLVVSSALCLRALLVGEEFDAPATEEVVADRRRLFAAFVRSLDAQGWLLALSVRWTAAGGVLTIAVWTWILAAKMLTAA